MLDAPPPVPSPSSPAAPLGAAVASSPVAALDAAASGSLLGSMAALGASARWPRTSERGTSRKRPGVRTLSSRVPPYARQRRLASRLSDGPTGHPFTSSSSSPARREPTNGDEGSTVSTVTRWPLALLCVVNKKPTASPAVVDAETTRESSQLRACDVAAPSLAAASPAANPAPGGASSPPPPLPGHW